MEDLCFVSFLSTFLSFLPFLRLFLSGLEIDITASSILRWNLPESHPSSRGPFLMVAVGRVLVRKWSLKEAVMLGRDRVVTPGARGRVHMELLAPGLMLVPSSFSVVRL